LQSFIIATKIILSLAFLVYASWNDYKTREVSNRVWAVYAPFALCLSLIELLLYEPAKLPFFGLSFGITVGLALLLFYSGGFGGADSKALMCIALALPFSTEILFKPIFGEVSPLSQNLFPLTIFTNSVLFAATSGLYMLSRNLIQQAETGKKLFEGTLATESIGKKLLVLITGYKVPIIKLKEKWHIYPMEDIADDSTNQLNRKIVLLPKDEGRNEIIDRLSNAIETGKITDHVWATPGLPMLIFITLGLITALFLGDIVWILVGYILG